MNTLSLETERIRLAALRSYRVLDTPREAPFDRITRIAQAALRAPMAQISFIDHERQWLKSSEGFSVQQIPRSDSFCTVAVTSDQPLVVTDTLADARFRELPLVTEEPFVRSYAGVPLRTPTGMRIGALCVMDTCVREIEPREIAILQDLAQIVMDELELRLVATTDALTGALSRRAFLRAASRDVGRVRRCGGDASCLLLDVDYFKSINDRFGHAAGDRALQEVVMLLRSDLRPDDYLGRIGGEEFAIMLPYTGSQAARQVGERLRRNVMEKAILLPEGELKLTVSVGVATLNIDDMDIEDLMRRADDALYVAKTSGRNRMASDRDDHKALVVALR